MRKILNQKKIKGVGRKIEYSEISRLYAQWLRRTYQVSELTTGADDGKGPKGLEMDSTDKKGSNDVPFSLCRNLEERRREASP